MTSPDPLSYGPRLTAALEPTRRALRALNRVMAPALRAGLGPYLATPVMGSLLLLRTKGRVSGAVREAPLEYALHDGRVLVLAGYGRSSHWFRNALAEPRVQVVLPGTVLDGVAEEITDPDERRAAFRVLVAALGLPGRATLGPTADLTDARVDELAAALPILAITPTAVRPGPFDPGGVAVRVNGILLLAPALVPAVWLVRRIARRCVQR